MTKSNQSKPEPITLNQGKKIALRHLKSLEDTLAGIKQGIGSSDITNLPELFDALHESCGSLFDMKAEIEYVRKRILKVAQRIEEEEDV